MANKKELKRKIKSVKNIGQVTKALEMVSAVKMRKAQLALKNATPYALLMEDMFDNFVHDLGEEQVKELLLSTQKKDTDKKENITIILISASRGFAGSLISNLSKKALELIEKRSLDTPFSIEEFFVFNDTTDQKQKKEQDAKVDIKLITVEKKSHDFSKHVPNEVIADFPKLSNPVVFEDILPIANIILNGYLNGSMQEVYIVYTHFYSTFSQKAVIQRLFPFNFASKKEENGSGQEPWYTYSTDQNSLFLEFYPVFIETLLFHSVLDAVAAEHSARMIAMKNATDNAIDLRKQYTFEYNQRRQAGITQEIAEITSAAETV